MMRGGWELPGGWTIGKSAVAIDGHIGQSTTWGIDLCCCHCEMRLTGYWEDGLMGRCGE